jgi:hypothetical protein
MFLQLIYKKTKKKLEQRLELFLLRRIVNAELKETEGKTILPEKK